MSEKKETYKLFNLPWYYFAVFAVVILLATYTGSLPKGMSGCFAFMIVLGTILYEIGEKTPIIRSYLGGGAIVVLFGTALLNYFNLLPALTKTLDDGTKQTLEGLAAVLRSTAKTMGTAGQIKDAKTSICDIIEDTWDEYTGDVNNLLLMDATAEAVSLTDSRNPSPESIQILIRTQEITMPDEDETEAEAAAEVQTTFWGRVAQMFKDFWVAITGLFGGKD